MKLLLVSVKSENPQGGIAVWTEHFLSQCHKMNIGCSLVNTELIGSRKTGKRRVFYEIVRTWRIFRDLRRCLKQETFDAAYLNTSCGSFGLFRDRWIAEWISSKKIPLITQYHCEIPWWVRRKASRRCLGRLVRLSRENLVLCQNSKNFLQEHYSVNAVKIPNFVEESIVLSENKEIRPQVERICFVGRVSEAKGACELFQVAKALPEIIFDLVGNVSAAAAAWDKPDNVELLGSMSHQQVLAHLDRADLFLFPSHTEGCSMALMEAMARGVPAIATDVGANADMLGDGCGSIVAKHDTDAMVSAIRFLGEPKLRGEMSRKAVEKVRSYYTEKNVTTIITLIKRLLREQN